MDELYADQQAGREPADPTRLFTDAGQIRTKVPLDKFPGHAAWLDNPWKLHRIEDKKARTVKWELYNLASDPKETNDLAEKEAARAATMRKQLETWLTSVAASLNGADYSR
jgi:arylsulfatase A-like enzyme